MKGVLKDRGDISAAGLIDIDPDEIKKSLPEFRQISDTGDSRGGEVVHEESKDLAMQALKKAFDMRSDVLLDRTLSNLTSARDLIAEARKADYEVYLIGVTVDVVVAVNRAMERAHDDNRYVPHQAILATHKGFSEVFHEIALEVDCAHLWDTSTTKARLIAVQEDGRFEILNQTAYDSFLRKRTINTNANHQDDVYGGE